MSKLNSYNAATIFLFSVTLIIIFGCRDSKESKADATSGNKLPEAIFLADAPNKEVSNVSTLKATAKEGDTVAIKVVVGGRDKIYVPNRAVFTVIDAKLNNPCTSEGDSCPTPWDYCCTPAEEKLPNMATVQIVGDDNRPLAVDLSFVENLKPLNTLIVLGTIGPRENKETLLINADGIYIDSK